jgi:hypothetical protein
VWVAGFAQEGTHRQNRLYRAADGNMTSGAGKVHAFNHGTHHEAICYKHASHQSGLAHPNSLQEASAQSWSGAALRMHRLTD